MIKSAIRTSTLATILAFGALGVASGAMAQTMPMVGGAPMDPAKTIPENASKASNLTTLVAAVKAAALTGRGGRTLAQAWREGADAFQGIALAGFPNFFLLLGPNTGLGHNSVLAMVEAQVAHVLGALRWLAKNPGRAVEVRADAQSAFRDAIDARLSDSIWARGGCGSWYLDGKGRNRTLWPGTATAYRRGAGRLRRGDYALVGPERRQPSHPMPSS